MIVYSIVNCARCGEDHESIEVKKFKLNPIDDYEWWGICPTTKEPIIIRVAEPDPEYMESE